MTSPWLAYNDLAWTEDFFADQSDYEEEVALYVELLKRSSADPPRTLLHLGCGAGGHDNVFKRHFEVTGVDISPGMLAKAHAAHPEIEYHEEDMRTIRLQKEFDVVVIPDSIDYMVTRDDLRQALRTATTHLKSGGVLLVVAKTAEIFRDNNFAYTGESGDVHVTLLENNYVNPHRPETYEATMVFLIRQAGKLTIHNDHHVLGLFPEAVWKKLFAEAGLTLQTSDLDGLYDRFLLGEGEYPMKVFVGVKMAG